ncbi:MAG: hypothetical protein AVDCRST_MAG85-4283, partial [uncultured Solirubrobacteraceae bacterium]
DQPRALESSRVDGVEHRVGEAGRRVEAPLGRQVLDLEVHARVAVAGEHEQLGERRDRDRLGRGRGRQLGPRQAEHVGAAAGLQLGQRERLDRTGAVRGPVERRVVQDDRDAVLRELDVDLEHEPAGRGGAERGHRVLGEHRTALVV